MVEHKLEECVMQYIIFKDHPGDIIKYNHKSGKMHLFLDIANQLIPIKKVSYQGSNKFIVYCKIPCNNIEKEFINYQLKIMQTNGEIFGFSI